MAVKNILTYGTESLREPSKEVHKVSKKISELVHDMLETMYAKNGVGLAAPQIGINILSHSSAPWFTCTAEAKFGIVANYSPLRQ